MRIVIVGAGINGLYLAWKLSQNGHKVTVFEKKEKIGKKVCSGLLSERILKFVPESRKLVQSQIEAVLIHFPRRTLRIKFSKKLLVISHFELDNLVAKLAANSGVKIILNHPISSIPEGFDRIIGCDGPNSIVRKNLDLPDPNCRLAIQGFTPAPLSSKSGGGFMETWPVKAGFLWKIPRGKEIEYGIITDPKEAKKLFEEFLKKNNLRLERIESALVPQGFLIPSHSSVTLCGDAAGLTKPWSGGGVIWGLTAADLLLKNFPDFLKYKKAVKKFFLPKITFSQVATKVVYFLGFNIPWLLPKKIKIESDFLLNRFL